jgi:hypothetical protein
MGASERDEWSRAAWGVPVSEALEANCLVFAEDEMGANTSLAPLHAWSRRAALIGAAKAVRNLMGSMGRESLRRSRTSMTR